MIFVKNPLRRYKRLLHNIPYWPYNYLCNIEVLEIAIKRKRSVSRFNYKVIKFDFFRKNLKIAKYSNRIKFFSDPMKNLHGTELTMYSKKWDDHSAIFVNLNYINPFEVAVQQLNATTTIITNDEEKMGDCFCSIDMHQYNDIEVAVNETFHLYPPKRIILYYIVPAIYDVIKVENYLGFLFNFIAILLILVILTILKKHFLHFDSHTWDLIITFSMIIGVSNPRNPVRFGETIVFSLLIVIGFFFGSELIFGLFSVNLV